MTTGLPAGLTLALVTAITAEEAHLRASELLSVLGERADERALAAVQALRDETLRRIAAEAELAILRVAITDGVTAIDPSGRIQFANDVIAHMSGFASPGEILALPYRTLQDRFEVLDPEGRPLGAEQRPPARALAGEPSEAVLRARLIPDGEERWFSLRSTPLLDDEGRVRLAVNVSRDITDSHYEQIARRFLADASAQLSSSLDFETTLSRVAELAVPTVADWCGIRIGHAVEDAPLAVAHTDPAKVAFARELGTRYPPNPDSPAGHFHVMRTGEPQLFHDLPPELLEATAVDDHHLELIRSLGLRSSLTVPLVARGKTLGTITFVQSESDRRFDARDLALAETLAERAAMAVDNAQLYQEAQDARERLDLALDAGEMGAFEFDLRRDRMQVSPSFARLHGVDREDWTSAAYRELIHEADREVLEREWAATLRERRPHHVSFRIVRPDGETRSMESRARLVLDARDEPAAMIGVTMDVTERRRADDAAARERERLMVTLRSIGDAVIATDASGTIVIMNAVAERLTGMAQADALGRPLSEVFRIFNAETGLVAADPVARVVATGAVVGLENHTVIESRDGVRRTIADSAAPIRTSDGIFLGVVLVFRDVTDQEELERELATANKLESLGVLAGGIAHDFNNLLTVIIANASMARARLGNGHPEAARLDQALHACERARELTTQLLTFAQGGAPVRQPLDLGPIIRQSAAFALHGSRAVEIVEIPDDLWPVHADAGQMGQVVQNLVLNAAQAMPDGGTIRISVANVEITADTSVPLPPGPAVRLRVADHGNGIAPEHLSRIFDPFFTTRKAGRGLGLATVYSIVKHHDGHIAVDSPGEGGTTFEIHLPATPAAPEHRPIREQAVPRGTGRVLVMDDEPGIRALTADLLGELGYTVDVAADGETALRAYAAARDAARPFDLVILDLTVPGGMGGREALQRLRAMDPGVRAIVSSGYSQEQILAEHEQHGFAGALQKPYDLGALARAVRAALGARRDG